MYAIVGIQEAMEARVWSVSQGHIRKSEGQIHVWNALLVPSLLKLRPSSNHLVKHALLVLPLLWVHRRYFHVFAKLVIRARMVGHVTCVCPVNTRQLQGKIYALSVTWVKLRLQEAHHLFHVRSNALLARLGP